MKSVVPFLLLLNVINAADDDWDIDDSLELIFLDGQSVEYYNGPKPYINFSSCKHKSSS